MFRKKLALETEKRLGVPKKNYNSSVAFEIDQQKIKVLRAIEPSTTSCEICDQCLADIQILISKIEMLNSENAELNNINQNSKIINSYISLMIFSFVNISKDECKFKSFSGLKVCEFQILYDYLILGINVKKKFMTKTGQKVPTNSFSTPALFSPVSKPGPKPEMKAIGQLFMFLNLLQ